MRNKKRYLISLICAVLVVVFSYGGYRVVRHENWQRDSIHQLQEQVNSQQETINSLQQEMAKQQSSEKSSQEAEKFVSACDDRHYSILFIGNSITRHGLADYWWSDDRGMASSSLDKDYVHLTAAALSKKSGLEENEASMNFYDWENQSYDRAETYSEITPYLNDHINTVVVQLGENVNDTTTFEKDFEELLKYIHQKASDAKIVVVGEFWKDDTKEAMKKEAASACGVDYADLSAIWDDTSYQAGLGTEVKGNDGKEHVIEHDGVAMHPGDKGMKYISEQVIKALQ